MEETPKAANKNGELRDLQYRIKQLEHLFVSASLNTPTLNSSLPSTDDLSLRSHNALVERISDLEGLLAASELDNQNLRQELSVLDMDKKRDDVILLEKLYAKDQDVQRLRNEVQLLEIKLQKAERAVENVKEYINTLPSQDELDEALDNVARLESGNHVLHQKVCVLESRFAEKERELAQNRKLLEDQNMRMEAVQHLEEAKDALLQSCAEGSVNLEDKKYVMELVTIQKAQILRSSKLISTFRDKLGQNQRETEVLQEKISSLEVQIGKLQEQLFGTQLTTDKITQHLKSVEQEKMTLLEEKANLQETLQDRENFIKQRDTQLTNIIKLVTEMDLCVNDIKRLVELGESIAKGEEPPVTSLLGLSDELEMHLQSLNNQETADASAFECDNGSNNSNHFNGSSKMENNLATKYLTSLTSEDFSLGNMEWALDRIKKIRDLRQNIGGIRDQLNDLYTDMVGGKIEGCNMQ